MAQLNPYGYTAYGVPAELITPEHFQAMTGGELSSSDEEVEAALRGASYAIRNYCHWHLAPNALCEWVGDAEGTLVQLPARKITSVDDVFINGQKAVEGWDYFWDAKGLIKLAKPLRGWGRQLRIRFHAGFDPEAIAHIVKQVAENALVTPTGIMNERAGDVSITYSQAPGFVAGSVHLLTDDKKALDAFRAR